jgi:1,4-dihydroxy-2-naphthoate octaprenyltransferase
MTQVSMVSPGHAWLIAIRPKTLPAAIAPVLVGTALAWAHGVSAPLPALAALVCALLIQIGTNLANDYFDYVKGTDIADRKGPTRVSQSGLLPLSQIRTGIVITFGLATLVGLYLIVVGGWPILAVGIASIISAIAYTGGPFPIGYHGLGDLFAFLFFGLVAVSGTYYVQASTLTPEAVIVALPVGVLTTAILVVNNLRDIDTDSRTGKRTLAVMVGPKATRLEYVLLLAVAYAVPLSLWLAGLTSAWVLLPCLTIPQAWHLVRTIYQSTAGPRLNKALAGTANLDLVFSLLLAIGLVL